MCVPLPHEQDTNSADTAYGIACLTILNFRKHNGAEEADAKFAERMGRKTNLVLIIKRFAFRSG
jgi:hypothetical protein